MSISTVTDLLHPARMRLGSPRTAGSPTAVPVHHDLPPAEYRLFTEAGDGVCIEEVSAGGNVPELRVANASRTAVLLVEGEVVQLTGHRTVASALVTEGTVVHLAVLRRDAGRSPQVRMTRPRGRRSWSDEGPH